MLISYNIPTEQGFKMKIVLDKAKMESSKFATFLSKEHLLANLAMVAVIIF